METKKSKLCFVFGLLIVLCLYKGVECQSDLITIYMNSQCAGPEEYKLLVDRGRCIDLPKWISERDNVSLNIEGYCLKMFETHQCKIPIIRGRSRPVDFHGCRNPRQIGLKTFKSFKIVPC